MGCDEGRGGGGRGRETRGTSRRGSRRDRRRTGDSGRKGKRHSRGTKMQSGTGEGGGPADGKQGLMTAEDERTHGSDRFQYHSIAVL